MLLCQISALITIPKFIIASWQETLPTGKSPASHEESAAIATVSSTPLDLFNRFTRN